jgi:hypothetical protein
VHATDTCTFAKLKALGKREAGLLVCYSKAAATSLNPTTFAACALKVEGKYEKAFVKAGSCSGDQTVCECIAENCATALRTGLPDAGPSKCEAARLKVAGKKAAAKLICNAEAARKGLPVDAGCIQKAEAKYQAAFAEAMGCSGDANTVENIVNQECVAALGADATGGATVGTLCTSCNVCCDVAGACAGGLSAAACIAAGGSPSNGSVCGVAETCVVPPSTGSGCCAFPNGSCGVNHSNTAQDCAAANGVWHTSAVCLPSGACQDR